MNSSMAAPDAPLPLNANCHFNPCRSEARRYKINTVTSFCFAERAVDFIGGVEFLLKVLAGEARAEIFDGLG